MSKPMIVTTAVDFSREARGRRRIEHGPKPETPSHQPGRVPRVARLLALALRFAKQMRTGELSSYVELADLGNVSRARISQIMNLINLAPDLQEAILFMPLTVRGRDAIHLRLQQPIAMAFDWKKQRRLWKDLTAGSTRLGETARLSRRGTDRGALPIGPRFAHVGPRRVGRVELARRSTNEKRPRAAEPRGPSRVFVVE